VLTVRSVLARVFKSIPTVSIILPWHLYADWNCCSVQRSGKIEIEIKRQVGIKKRPLQIDGKRQRLVHSIIGKVW